MDNRIKDILKNKRDMEAERIYIISKLEDQRCPSNQADPKKEERI